MSNDSQKAADNCLIPIQSMVSEEKEGSRLYAIALKLIQRSEGQSEHLSRWAAQQLSRLSGSTFVNHAGDGSLHVRLTALR